MKKWKVLMPLLVYLACMGMNGNAQSYEAEQLILDWTKLTEMKQTLDDMYSGYKIVSAGYSAIRDIAHGSFDLHQAFLDGLLVVSPGVRNYYKVAAILSGQQQLVMEYKHAYARFRADPYFTVDELSYIGTVYGQLFSRSEHMLDALTTLLTDGSLRASDDERLQQIDGLYRDMQQQLHFLRQFNDQTALLSLQRARDGEDIRQLRSLYGISQ